jgi:hypothetical protein
MIVSLLSYLPELLQARIRKQVARTAARIGVLSPPEPLTALDVFQHGSLDLGYTDRNSIHECQRLVSA